MPPGKASTSTSPPAPLPACPIRPSPALEELVAEGGGDDTPGLQAELKADPGRLGLETLLGELAKLGSDK